MRQRLLQNKYHYKNQSWRVRQRPNSHQKNDAMLSAKLHFKLCITNKAACHKQNQAINFLIQKNLMGGERKITAVCLSE